MSACTSSAVAAHAAAAVSSAGRPSRSAQQRCLAQRSSHASKVKSVRSLTYDLKVPLAFEQRGFAHLGSARMHWSDLTFGVVYAALS